VIVSTPPLVARPGAPGVAAAAAVPAVQLGDDGAAAAADGGVPLPQPLRRRRHDQQPQPRGAGASGDKTGGAWGGAGKPEPSGGLPRGKAGGRGPANPNPRGAFLGVPGAEALTVVVCGELAAGCFLELCADPRRGPGRSQTGRHSLTINDPRNGASQSQYFAYRRHYTVSNLRIIDFVVPPLLPIVGAVVFLFSRFLLWCRSIDVVPRLIQLILR